MKTDDEEDEDDDDMEEAVSKLSKLSKTELVNQYTKGMTKTQLASEIYGKNHKYLSWAGSGPNVPNFD